MELELFENGQYRSLLEKLQEVKQDGSGPRSVVEQLSHINNQAVCRYLAGKDADDKKSCSLEFVDVLKKCKSVPAREEILCMELASLYNYMYHVTESEGNISDRATDVTDMHNQAYRTLSRVGRLLSKQKPQEDTLKYQDVKSANIAMLYEILQKLQYGIGNVSLSESVCQCIVPLTVHEIKHENHKTAYRLLEKAKIVLSNIETGGNKHRSLCLPLRIEHSSLHLMKEVHIKDSMSLLMGICLSRNHKWDDAFSVLEEISTSLIRSLAQFYCGFALYKSGKYTESISNLLQVLRSGQSLTQRLKARIYNLIGKCFDKLNKHQLSVQMFKEALCADFSYLVPLFNTSLQYRNQGVKDMELECLNLLVNALDMREKSEVSYERMDLACLMDTEDDDISYTRALYLLSQRSFQLQRYRVAAEKYMCLLDHLRSWKASTKELATCIPPLLQVHHEAIEALLMSQQYEDCVSLCDRVLLCYHYNTSSFNDTSVLSQTLYQTPSQVSAGDSQTESRKRKLDDSSLSQEEHFGEVDVIALKYKAKALVKMGDNSGSLVCLEKAIDCITSFRKYRLHQRMKAVTQSTEPSSKRQRIDETSSSSKDDSSIQSDNQLPSTSGVGKVLQSDQHTSDTVSAISELLQDSSRMLQLEQDLYELTAEILASMDKSNDSRHYNRLASQIQVIKDRL